MISGERWNTAVSFMAAYLLIFISGSMRFNASQDKFLLAVFLIAVVLLIFKVKKVDLGFLLYCCVFLAFLFLIWGYTDGSLSLSSAIGTIIRLVTAYALVAFLRDLFVDRMLQVIYFLALVSLIGFMIDQLHLLTPLVTRLPVIGNGVAYEGFLYGFRSSVHPDRNHSIFYEPGAYQLFLNAALYALVFFKGNWEQKRRLKYLVVILIALVTTQSTTAYLMTAMILAAAFVKSNVISLRQKVTLAVGVAFVVAVFSGIFYNTVVHKISDYLDIQDMADSSNRRSFDPLVDLDIVKRYPLGVGLEKYRVYFAAIGRIPDTTSGSSNGITRLFAIYGIPFGAFLLLSYSWFFIRCLGMNVVSLLGMGLLLIALWSQSYFIFAPVCMALIGAFFVFGNVRTPLPVRQT